MATEVVVLTEPPASPKKKKEKSKKEREDKAGDSATVSTDNNNNPAEKETVSPKPNKSKTSSSSKKRPSSKPSSKKEKTQSSCSTTKEKSASSDDKLKKSSSHHERKPKKKSKTTTTTKTTPKKKAHSKKKLSSERRQQTRNLKPLLMSDENATPEQQQDEQTDPNSSKEERSEDFHKYRNVLASILKEGSPQSGGDESDSDDSYYDDLLSRHASLKSVAMKLKSSAERESLLGKPARAPAAASSAVKTFQDTNDGSKEGSTERTVEDDDSSVCSIDLVVLHKPVTTQGGDEDDGSVTGHSSVVSAVSHSSNSLLGDGANLHLATLEELQAEIMQRMGTSAGAVGGGGDDSISNFQPYGMPLNSNSDHTRGGGSDEPPASPSPSVSSKTSLRWANLSSATLNSASGHESTTGSVMSAAPTTPVSIMKNNPKRLESQGSSSSLSSHRRDANTKQASWRKLFAQDSIRSLTGGGGENDNKPKRHQPPCFKSPTKPRPKLSPAESFKRRPSLLATMGRSSKRLLGLTSKDDDSITSARESDVASSTTATENNNVDTKKKRVDETAARILATGASVSYSLFDKEYAGRKDARLAALRAERSKQKEEEETARVARARKWEKQRKRHEAAEAGKKKAQEEEEKAAQEAAAEKEQQGKGDETDDDENVRVVGQKAEF